MVSLLVHRAFRSFFGIKKCGSSLRNVLIYLNYFYADINQVGGVIVFYCRHAFHEECLPSPVTVSCVVILKIKFIFYLICYAVPWYWLTKLLASSTLNSNIVKLKTFLGA